MKDERGVSVAMNNEAVALQGLKRYEEAVQIYKRIIELSVKVYGLVDTNTAIYQDNLAYLYYAMQNWDEAEVLISRALKTFKKLQKPMSPAIRGAQLSLGRVLRDSGKDLIQAELLIKEVLDYEIKHVGVNNPSVMLTLVNHARCVALKGEHERALENYVRCLPVLTKQYGEDYTKVKELRNWIIEAKDKLNKNL